MIYKNIKLLQIPKKQKAKTHSRIFWDFVFGFYIYIVYKWQQNTKSEFYAYEISVKTTLKKWGKNLDHLQNTKKKLMAKRNWYVQFKGFSVEC